MGTTYQSGDAYVDRYWQLVRERPSAEHLYVTLLGLRAVATADLRARLAGGLSYESLERFRRVLGVPINRVSELVRISPRTLARRKQSRRLQPEESDRLVRLARIVGLAVQLFEGDLTGARSWLGAPHEALAGQTPLESATTDVGAREVENLIGRLEYGMPL